MSDIATALRVIDFLIGIVVICLSGAITLVWAELRAVRGKNHDQQGEIHKLNLLVAGNYVSRAELDHHMKRLEDTMARGFDKMERQMADIYDELKHKVDKP